MNDYIFNEIFRTLLNTLRFNYSFVYLIRVVKNWELKRIYLVPLQRIYENILNTKNLCAGLVTTGSAFFMSFFKESSTCSFAEN